MPLGVAGKKKHSFHQHAVLKQTPWPPKGPQPVGYMRGIFTGSYLHQNQTSSDILNQDIPFYNNVSVCKFSKQFYRCSRRVPHSNSVSMAVLDLLKTAVQLPWLYSLPREEEIGALLAPKKVKDDSQRSRAPQQMYRRERYSCKRTCWGTVKGSRRTKSRFIKINIECNLS